MHSKKKRSKTHSTILWEIQNQWNQQREAINNISATFVNQRF